MAIQRSNDAPLRELALFAGSGGGILGGHLLGWETVCAVERDSYAASVLAQRQNDGHLRPFPIWSDVCSFDGKPWRGIADVVSGGFPCQDISVAGKGAGITGERSGLWKQFARIIGEVRPRFAYIENSTALVTRGLDVVLCDLAALGFDAEWGCLSAGEIGAPHERDRLWILATDANCQRNAVRGNGQDNAEELAGRPVYVGGSQRDSGQGCAEGAGESAGAEIPDADSAQCERNERAKRIEAEHSDTWQYCRWPDEPNLPRVANGLAYRMDRLKAIGNGQVPRVAAAAFTELASRLPSVAS